MERQKENEQQHRGANIALELVRILDAGNNHWFKLESENS
jgi:hypothetical protein